MAIKFCSVNKRLNTVVQAGGSIGVWPKILSKHFQTVYTFEPEPISFECLDKNVIGMNVIKSNTALGESNCIISMDRKSLTAHKVNKNIVGSITMITLDSLYLDKCDALLLDVEGYEWNVLQGAVETIHKFKPLILVEALKDKINPVHLYLTKLGYEKTMHIELDDIYEYRKKN
jgi:FkbM family methyltransferase